MPAWLQALHVGSLYATARVDPRHALALKALLLLAGLVLAFLAAWIHGLPQRVWQDDPTGVSLGITVLFLIAFGHAALHTVRLSRTIEHLGEVERAVSGTFPDSARWLLPPGLVAAHVRKLVRKASNGAESPFDQSLLLDSFETELRHGLEFGWFVADLLLSLGLLGTVIGFILMLGPIDGLDASDQGAIRGALGAMTGGMAVALYTTLTGLVGGIVLRVLALLLEGAVEEVVRRTTDLTEIWVLPALVREGRARTREDGHAQAA
jgi:biopolymer transport protein ExbB/TolQ